MLLRCWPQTLNSLIDHGVARIETVNAISLDTVAHRLAEVGHEGRNAAAALRDGAAIAVEQADAIVLHLVDDGAEGRAREIDLAFVEDAYQEVTYNLDGHRIDLCLGTDGDGHAGTLSVIAI